MTLGSPGHHGGSPHRRLSTDHVGHRERIKRVTYLRLAACLPLLPIAGVPALNSGLVGNGAWEGLLGVLIASVAVGGIPYVGAAAVSLYLLRDKPASAYWRLARWAPLIFVPIFGAALVAFGLVGGLSSGLALDRSILSAALLALPLTSALYALYVLPVGYGYVLLAWLGYRLLDWLGQLESDA